MFNVYIVWSNWQHCVGWKWAAVINARRPILHGSWLMRRCQTLQRLINSELRCRVGFGCSRRAGIAAYSRVQWDNNKTCRPTLRWHSELTANTIGEDVNKYNIFSIFLSGVTSLVRQAISNYWRLTLLALIYFKINSLHDLGCVIKLSVFINTILYGSTACKNNT